MKKKILLFNMLFIYSTILLKKNFMDYDKIFEMRFWLMQISY